MLRYKLDTLFPQHCVFLLLGHSKGWLLPKGWEDAGGDPSHQGRGHFGTTVVKSRIFQSPLWCFSRTFYLFSLFIKGKCGTILTSFYCAALFQDTYLKLPLIMLFVSLIKVWLTVCRGNDSLVLSARS